jgi:hypothetical protein
MPREELTYDSTLMDSLDEDMTPLPQEFDADADYNAPPPPLPDGWHQAVLQCAGVMVGEKREPFTLIKWKGDQTEKGHYWTAIEAKVVDPGGLEDGKFASDGLVRTRMDARNHNTSAVANYYRAITGNPIPGVSEAQHMKALILELQAKPQVWIKTQLEGQAAEASKAFRAAKKAGTLAPGDKGPKTFKGERAFYENGKLTGRTYDDAAKEIVVGRATIVDVKPSSFVPPAVKR